MQTRSDNGGVLHVFAVRSICTIANAEYDERYAYTISLNAVFLKIINYFYRYIFQYRPTGIRRLKREHVFCPLRFPSSLSML